MKPLCKYIRFIPYGPRERPPQQRPVWIRLDANRLGICQAHGILVIEPIYPLPKRNSFPTT